MKGITNKKESNKKKSDLNAQRAQKSGVLIGTAHTITLTGAGPLPAGAPTLSAPFAMAKKTMPTINAAANGKAENKSTNYNNNKNNNN